MSGSGQTRRIGYALAGVACLVSSIVVGSLAFTGSFTWGYDRTATYRPFISDRSLGDVLSGERLVSTNNGALALLITPLLAIAIALLYRTWRAGDVWEGISSYLVGSALIAAVVSFPVYAIVLVDGMYDQGQEWAVHPCLVMWLPTVLLLGFFSMLYFNEQQR